MHIPDNYLSPTTCFALYAIMIVVLKKATTKVKSEVSKKKLPLIGVSAAFSFLVMMFNVPLPGGTSGHAVGATLVAILLGPYTATISLAVVHVIQAFLFGDGGILALGANIFNVGIVMPFVGYYVFNLIKGDGEKRNYVAAFVAAYVAVNVSAILTAVELGMQPLLFKSSSGLPMYFPYSLKISLTSMMIPHLLFVGILEGVITVGVYSFIKKTSPDIIYESSYKKRRISFKELYGLIFAMIVLSPIGLLASGSPWGEWTSEEFNKLLGYIPIGIEKGYYHDGIIPDYTLPGMLESISYIVSAVLGVAAIIIIVRLINKIALKNR